MNTYSYVAHRAFSGRFLTVVTNLHFPAVMTYCASILLYIFSVTVMFSVFEAARSIEVLTGIFLLAVSIAMSVWSLRSYFSTDATIRVILSSKLNESALIGDHYGIDLMKIYAFLLGLSMSLVIFMVFDIMIAHGAPIDLMLKFGTLIACIASVPWVWKLVQRIMDTFVP